MKHTSNIKKKSQRQNKLTRQLLPEEIFLRNPDTLRTL